MKEILIAEPEVTPSPVKFLFFFNCPNERDGLSNNSKFKFILKFPTGKLLLVSSQKVIFFSFHNWSDEGFFFYYVQYCIVYYSLVQAERVKYFCKCQIFNIEGCICSASENIICCNVYFIFRLWNLC